MRPTPRPTPSRSATPAPAANDTGQNAAVVHEAEQNANAEAGDIGNRTREDQERLVRPRSDRLPPPVSLANAAHRHR